ncbi:MAG TPA: hypothetical protein VNJ53_05800 [Gaiellaceae bacterium]|nr:hypothetical protein [Gaiellaceae bacterium]
MSAAPGLTVEAALLDSLFANAPLGLAYVDEELRFVRVNERLGR